MDQVIQKIQELYSALQNAINEARVKRDEANRQAKEQAAFAEILNVRESNLDDREVEIKKVENVIDLANKARNVMNDANGILKKTEILAEQNRMERGNIVKDLRTIVNQRADIKYQSDGLIKERKVLEKEKAEYKDKIIEDIKSRI